MLVLSRKDGEKIRIDDDVTITVLSVQGSRVRLGIEAPGSYRVLRAELTEQAHPRKPTGRMLGRRMPQAVAVS